MTGFDWLEISSWAGLGATIFLTLQFMLGMMMGIAYKKTQWWKRIPRRFKLYTVFQLHHAMAKTAIVLILLHAVVILFSINPTMTITELLFPFTGKHQPIVITLGSISFYSLLFILLTSLPPLRATFSFRKWKNIHLAAYCLAPLFVLHGLLVDQTLKDQEVDWLDGEKLVSLICGAIIITATISRYRYHKLHPVKKEQVATGTVRIYKQKQEMNHSEHSAPR